MKTGIREVAAALGVSKQAALKRATKEGWAYEESAGRGGRRRLYQIARLPADVQANLAGKVLSAASAATPAPASSSFGATPSAGAILSSTRGVLEAAAPLLLQSSPAPQSGASPDPRSESLAAHFDSKPAKQKEEAQARLAMVRAFHALTLKSFKRDAALLAVCAEARVSPATLSRYLGKVRGQPEHLWLQLLCPNHVGRTAEAEFSAEAWEELKADYLRLEKPSAAECIKRLRRKALKHGWVLPKDRTIGRRLKDLPRAIVVMKREGMQAAKALYPAQQRDKTALQALEIINGDGYQHNLWCRFPDGEVARPKTWFWQDVYSSKILAWCTDKTEHTDTIRFAFGMVAENWGIPGAVTIDNTMAAANKAMSGGIRHRFRFKVRAEEPDGVFKAFNVSVHWATPRHGQAKPIERIFGTGGIGECIDKAPEFAGAWTGASSQDKPQYDEKHRAVELDELEAVIVREVEALNAHAGRRGAVHKGRSFDEVFNESYARIVVRKPTEAQRRLWLLSTEPVRAASKDGAITLDAGRVRGERLANRYWADALVDLAGKQLVARFDPRRLHEGVHVYTLDNRWICFAPCDKPEAFNDANAGRERNRARNNWVRSKKAQAVAEVRMDVLDRAKTHSLTPSGGAAPGVIPAPRVLRATFTDPLERPRFVPREASAEETAELERFKDTAPAQVNVLELRSDADKHEHWKALDGRRGAGETLTERDEQFWGHWQTEEYFRLAIESERDFEELLRQRRA